MRKICIVTGARAEYGLLRWVMQYIKEDANLCLQIIVTGMHLSPEFGLTYKAIESDGFVIDRKIEMLTSSDTPVGITKSMGLGLIGFADALNELSPDLLLVLGDRFEIFSAAAAALLARIPIAHIHGGESTEGAIDEAIRHSITKMAHLHFVASDQYKKRVIQLGEHPENVFMVGGMGIDNIKRLKLLNRKKLESDFGFKFGKKNLLITFHPATLDSESAEIQLQELLLVLHRLQDTQLIFTMSNADANGRALIKMVKDFVAIHENAHAFTSLGQLRYLSCIAQVDAVIGNSSSGLLEVPSFKKGTINIGDRQHGRLQSTSVIQCEPTQKSIKNALNKLYSSTFQISLKSVVNPYGEGGASEKVFKIVKSKQLDRLIKKSFYNLG